MRTLLFAAAVLAAAGPARADEAEARAVVERAVAAGGGGKLAGLRAGVWKTNGTVQGRTSKADFHGELPGRFRIDSTRPVDGKPTRFSRIVDGDKGWVVEGEAVRPMTAAEIQGVRASFYHKQAVTTLVPLLDKGCKLELVGPDEVNGRPATVVRASREGFPDVVIAFDRETGLPARSSVTDTNAATGKERRVELVLSDYKEFGGVKMPGRTRTYHDGKLFLDVELLDFKASASLPAGTFAKP
jgi:outer membrane lipoprotein-sorting protein